MTRRKIILIAANLFLVLVIACCLYIIFSPQNNKINDNISDGVSYPFATSISDPVELQLLPVPTKADEKFVLTEDRLLVASGSSLLIIGLGNTEKIIDFPSEIIGVYPSFDEKKIAVTYSTGNPSRMFDYSKSKLAVVDLSTKKMQEVISSGDNAINYIYWSFDNKYFTFWVGSGVEAFVYDVSKSEPIYSIKGGTVSPIVFLESGKIAFIENGSLIESDVNGENSKEIYKGVMASRSVHEGPSIPNIPFYSQSGKFVLFYNSNADLVIKDKQTDLITTLGKGEFSEMFRENYPQAYVAGFFNSGKVLFQDYKGANGYSYGEKMPLYIYDPIKQEIKEFIANDGIIKAGNADLSSLFFAPGNDRFVAHSVYSGQGFDIYDEEGKLLQTCGKTDFRYPFYNWGGGPNYASGSTVWSLSSIFLVAESNKDGLSVVDVNDCKTHRISDSVFSPVVWIR